MCSSDLTDKATRRVLSKFGAFVRTRARTSIRRRKAASAAGSPPSSHTGLLRRWILFGYDAGSRSVVIGPAKLGGAKGSNAPAALEYGGPATNAKGRAIQIGARPFMRPAFNRAKGYAVNVFANAATANFGRIA